MSGVTVGLHQDVYFKCGDRKIRFYHDGSFVPYIELIEENGKQISIVKDDKDFDNLWEAMEIYGKMWITKIINENYEKRGGKKPEPDPNIITGTWK